MLLNLRRDSQDGGTSAGRPLDRPAAPERLGRPGPSGIDAAITARLRYQGSVVETENTMRPSLLPTSPVIFWSPLASVPVYFSASEKWLKS